MKICLFITRFIRGGAQKVVLELTRALVVEHEVTLVIGKTAIDEPNLLGEVSAEARLVRFDRVGREICPVNDLRALFELRNFFKREAFDVVHLHTSKAGVLGAFAGRLAKVKRVIYTPHGHIFHDDAAIPGVSDLPAYKKRVLYFLRKRAYASCDVLTALSEADKAEQVDLGLASAEKFFVVMNGVDVPSFSARDDDLIARFQSEWNPRGNLVVGSVGRLSSEKGHDILLHAFRRILEVHPKTRLIVVGDGAERDPLLRLAERLDLRDEVVFTGDLEDPRPALWSMDVFALPSRYESQGMAAMEAMAAGVPVVAANVGGVPDVIDDGKDGLLATAGDPTSFADRISSLLADVSQRDHLSRNAMIKAKREFALSSMIDNYFRLYRG